MLINLHSINCWVILGGKVILTKQVQAFISTSNSMGSSEIWDKYHECCIGNGDKFHEAKNTTSVVLEMGINFMRRSRVKFTISNTTLVVFIPNFTAIPMLFPVDTILAAYTHAVH